MATEYDRKVAELMAAGYTEAHAREFAKYGYIRATRLPRRSPRASGHAPKSTRTKRTK